MPDVGLLAILALGILLGALAANAGFRRKFFIGFRRFLGGINTGQRRRRKIVDESSNASEQRDVRRRYVRTIKLIRCPRCQGSGKVRRATHKLSATSPAGEQQITCSDCNGTGEVEE